VGVSWNESILFKKILGLKKEEKLHIKNLEHELKKNGELDNDIEYISGLLEESCFGDTMRDLLLPLDLDFGGDDKIWKVYSTNFYDEIKKFMEMQKVIVETKITKYKIVAKKVKLVVLTPPFDFEKVEKASIQPNLKDPRKIGHEFTNETLGGSL